MAHGGGGNHASHGMRLNVTQNDTLYIAMPGYLGGEFKTAGIKWHGPNKVLPNNDADSHYVVILNREENGKPYALLRADVLTRYRTAGIAALATKLLSYDKPQVLSVIGPGKINYLTSLFVLGQFKTIKKVLIKGRGLKSRESYINGVKKAFNNVEIKDCDSLKDAVIDADIILINPGLYFDKISDMPVIKPSWIKERSVYICSSYANFSDKDIINNTINVCDLFASYESYEEELGYPAYRAYGTIGNRFADLVIEKKLAKESIIDLADIVAGKHASFDGKTIIFSSGGMSLEDIALGKYLYDKAITEHRGVELL